MKTILELSSVVALGYCAVPELGFSGLVAIVISALYARSRRPSGTSCHERCCGFSSASASFSSLRGSFSVIVTSRSTIGLPIALARIAASSRWRCVSLRSLMKAAPLRIRAPRTVGRLKRGWYPVNFDRAVHGFPQCRCGTWDLEDRVPFQLRDMLRW